MSAPFYKLSFVTAGKGPLEYKKPFRSKARMIRKVEYHLSRPGMYKAVKITIEQFFAPTPPAVSGERGKAPDTL